MDTLENIDLDQPILITGGTGFVGSHLLEYLQGLGYKNIHLTSYNEASSWFLERLDQKNIHQLDLTNHQDTKSLLDQLAPTQIYHLASIASVGDSFDKLNFVLENNIKLQLSLLTAVKELSLKTRILVVGSADEYGVSLPQELPINEHHPLRPVNPYAASKVTQDMLGHVFYKAYGLDIVRARPFAHIGPRQTDAFVVAAFAKQIALIEQGKQEAIYVGNLKAKRDFTDVTDVVAAYHLLMIRGKSGEVYNIGSGKSHSIRSVLDQLIGLSPSDIKVVVDKNRLRPVDIDDMVADIKKIKNLGWQPTVPLSASLANILNYWRNTL